MSFDDAFNFTMRHEVGPWWDPTDPDVIALRHSTPEQKRKVGYVNHVLDKGGETLLGIAKNANPHLDFDKLTLAEAKKYYFDHYWMPTRCNELAGRLAVLMFDAAVNHGVKRAVILLQRAVGAMDDGDFGPKTLAAVHKAAPSLTAKQLVAPRRKFFLDIVTNNPSQKAFITGWLNRVNDLEKYLGEL